VVSVKTNIGHLDAAAGTAGIIKTVLFLKASEIPRIYIFSPNPEIDFSKTPFFVNSQLAGNGKAKVIRKEPGHGNRYGGALMLFVILEEGPKN